jgi:HEAT repeat protein
VPALLEKRSDAESNDDASNTLYQIGLRLHRYGDDEQAARALVGALFPAGAFGPRGDAIAALKQLGPSAATELAALLKSRHPAERETAASTLKELGPGAIPAVPALREALSDPVRSVRDAAACALAEPAPETREIVPVLKAMTTGTDLEKQAASEALGRLKAQADAASLLLEPLLAADNSLDVRLAAACGLVRLERAKAREVVPPLVEVVKTRLRFRAVIDACDALASIGPQAHEAIEPLEQLADITTWPSPFSQDNREYQASEIRRHAASALGKIRKSRE